MDKIVNKLRIVSLPSLCDQHGVAATIASVARFYTSTFFEVQLNPEQVVRNFKIKYNEPKEHGVQQDDLQIQGTEPEVLELKFILDGTGAASYGLGGDLVNAVAIAAGDNKENLAYVSLKIAQLKNAVYDFIDETHRPPFLVVFWGTLVFFGVLEDMVTTYNLFHPSGVPLRAEVNLKIKSQKVPKLSSALQSFLSPDLTRRHTVIGGDNILTVTRSVYDSEKYYLEVAKVNKLVNFRSLKPNSELQLPPIAQ